MLGIQIQEGGKAWGWEPMAPCGLRGRDQRQRMVTLLSVAGHRDLLEAPLLFFCNISVPASTALFTCTSSIVGPRRLSAGEMCLKGLRQL